MKDLKQNNTKQEAAQKDLDNGQLFTIAFLKMLKNLINMYKINNDIDKEQGKKPLYLKTYQIIEIDQKIAEIQKTGVSMLYFIKDIKQIIDNLDYTIKQWINDDVLKQFRDAGYYETINQY